MEGGRRVEDAIRAHLARVVHGHVHACADARAHYQRLSPEDAAGELFERLREGRHHRSDGYAVDRLAVHALLREQARQQEGVLLEGPADVAGQLERRPEPVALEDARAHIGVTNIKDRKHMHGWRLAPSASPLPTGTISRCRNPIRWNFSGSGKRDLNSRPPGPKPGALPGCAIPRRAVV